MTCFEAPNSKLNAFLTGIDDVSLQENPPAAIKNPRPTPKSAEFYPIG